MKKRQQKPARTPARPYHHGDLKAALLREAERVLEAGGVSRVTLREVSRRAGVSHTAPKNHFGDLSGLLSELAAVGFVRFGQALGEAASSAGEDAKVRMQAMGRAYVRFARAHPGLFSLMYRSEVLDPHRPALAEAIAGTRSVLVAAVLQRAQPAGLTPLQVAAQATAVWALVHGFSVLLLDGRLDNTIKALPGKESAEGLLEAVLLAASVGE